MAEPTAEDDARIAVGVDGSPASKVALRWAVRQARLTGARVEAVTAWQFPTYSSLDGLDLPVNAGAAGSA